MKDLIRKNRSYRRFDETKKQTREMLASLVESARFSPSAGNMQRLRFLPIVDGERCDKVFSTLKFAGYLKEWNSNQR